MTSLATITAAGSLTIQDGAALSVAAIADAGNITVGSGSTLTVGGQFASLRNRLQFGISAVPGGPRAEPLGPSNVATYGNNQNAWTPATESGGTEDL